MQIVGIVQLLATIASMFLVDRAGRRLLLLISGIFMSIALAALGTFFYLGYLKRTAPKFKKHSDGFHLPVCSSTSSPTLAVSLMFLS